MKTQCIGVYRGFKSHPLRQLILNKFLCFQSARNARNAQTAQPRYTAGTRPLVGTLFFLAVFSALPCLAQQTAKTYRVPFHSVNGMILLDATVNGKPAVLLLDTGAEFTIISAQASGLSAAKLHTLTANKAAGANGEYVKSRVDLILDKRHWIDREVLVMDLNDSSKRLGTRIDGFIGQDVLREFQGVHIDYKARTVTLEN